VQKKRSSTAKYFDRWPVAEAGTTVETSHTGIERKPTTQHEEHGLLEGGVCEITHDPFFLTV
jgi:hypothetical protein